MSDLPLPPLPDELLKLWHQPTGRTPRSPMLLAQLVQAYAREAVSAAVERVKAEYDEAWEVKSAMLATAHRVAESAAEPDGDEYDETENAARHILNVMLDGETDEFNAWYKPEQWLGIHRAAAGFLKVRFVPIAKAEKGLEPVASHDDLMLLADEYAVERKWQQEGLPSPKRAALYDALHAALAHPPTQVEPVAERVLMQRRLQSATDLCENEWYPWEEVFGPHMTKRQTDIFEYAWFESAHPPVQPTEPHLEIPEKDIVGIYFTWEDGTKELAAPALEELKRYRAAVQPTEPVLKALRTIEQWELPASGRFCEDGSPMSYEAAFGSNGAREYMRAVARDALAHPPVQPTEPTK